MYRPFQTPIRIAFMKSTPEVLHITCSFTLWIKVYAVRSEAEPPHKLVLN